MSFFTNQIYTKNVTLLQPKNKFVINFSLLLKNFGGFQMEFNSFVTNI